MDFLRKPSVAQLLASLLLVLRHFMPLHCAQTLVLQCSILLHRPQTGRSHMVFLRKPLPDEDSVAAATADLNVHSGAGANAHPGPAGTVAVTLDTNPAPGSDEVRVEKRIFFWFLFVSFVCVHPTRSAVWALAAAMTDAPWRHPFPADRRAAGQAPHACNRRPVQCCIHANAGAPAHVACTACRCD